MSWRRLALTLIACSCVTKPGAAHAPPLATGIRWLKTGDAERAVVRTNRGLIIEEPAGGTFRIVCNEAFDTSLGEVPPLVVRPDGSLLLGTYAAGLVVSSPDRCSFESVAGAFEGSYPIALGADAEGSVYAAVLPLDGSSAQLVKSTDQGRTGEPLTTMPGAPTALEIAPSDDSRLYVSITTAKDNLSFGSLLTSRDAGRSFAEHAIELDASELRVFLVAVAPNDPKLLFVRTQSRDGVTPERLLRSDDGGDSFETVLSAPGPITAVARANGPVWAGAADGLYRSEDEGRSFLHEETSDVTRVTCLAERSEALYACGYSAGEFGVLVSADDREAFDWFLRFPQVTARLDCAADSDEAQRCAEAFADWRLEQLVPEGTGGESGAPAPGNEAGAPPKPPSAPARSREAGCQLERRAPGSPGLILLGVLLAVGAQRRKMTMTSVSSAKK